MQGIRRAGGKSLETYHVRRSVVGIQAAANAELDAHFAIEQRMRAFTSCFINFNGTAGIWRKSCIEDAGGWAQDNLTEDFDLSFRAQLKGWTFLFLPDVEVPAELPVSMNAHATRCT